MTTQKSRRLRTGLAVLVAVLSLPLLPSYGDTITLKNGDKLEGKITLEATDFVKIELARSGSIKETKLVKRADIATIAKTQADALALAEIKQNLPTRSLMTSSAYQSLIQTGPEAFLKAYPESLHKTEVSKILEDLKAEKAKVDRGGIKLEGEWISTEKRQNFKTLINSRIRLYSMRQKAARRDHTSAMRDFQIIENQFVGTPAYPEGVKVAISILPTYGQLLTRQLKDAEFLNKKREADIKLLPPENQARTQAAYKKEQDRFKALAEQEQKTGVKWRSVNRRNKDSIAPMIDTVRKELDDLRKIDTSKFAEQARLLVQVDELINENKLKEAEEKLVEAGGKRKKSTGKKRSKAKSTYSDDLSEKIAYKIQAAETAAENATISAKAKKVAATISQTASRMAKKGEDSADKGAAEAETKSADNALEAAMAARKKAADAKKTKADAKTAAKKPKSTKTTKSSTKSSSDIASDSGGGGGGINFQVLLIGFVVVMGIVIVVLKKMGIGGGKGDGGGGGN